MPTWVYWVTFFGSAIALHFVLWWNLRFLDEVQTWLIAFNTVAFVSYRFDKNISETVWTRVPERLLLALVLSCGGIGAYAAMQRKPRHKTQRPDFLVKFWKCAIGSVVLLLVYLAVGRPLLSNLGL
jgi:uncharacterized membrane protein YsdA (DUF1294 family)